MDDKNEIDTDVVAAGPPVATASKEASAVSNANEVVKKECQHRAAIAGAPAAVAISSVGLSRTGVTASALSKQSRQMITTMSRSVTLCRRCSLVMNLSIKLFDDGGGHLILSNC